MNLGVPELMIIFLLALVLFGPKKLPEIGKTVGKAMAEFRRATSELKSTLEREVELDKMKSEFSEIGKTIKDGAADIRAGFSGLNPTPPPYVEAPQREGTPEPPTLVGAAGVASSDLPAENGAAAGRAAPPSVEATAAVAGLPGSSTGIKV